MPALTQKSSRLLLPGLLLLSLLTAGCGGLQKHVEQERMQQDAHECQQLGWEAGTPEYDQCMEGKRQQRAETETGLPDSFLQGGWWLGSWF